MVLTLRSIRAAFAFLTRIPVGGFPFVDEEWRWAPAHFPLVGALLGAVLGCLWLAVRSLGGLSAAVLVVVAALILTGAFHEDGLADTADALGAGATREQTFAILKDSRIGTFGAAALFGALLTRVVLLAALERTALAGLLVSQCLARLPPVWLLALLPYVTPHSTARSQHVARVGYTQVLIATGWTVLLLAGMAAYTALGVTQVLAAVFGAIASAAVCGFTWRARLGGVTGDLLGATEQVAECSILLALALSTPIRSG